MKVRLSAPRRWSLAAQILATQLVVAFLVVGAGLAGSYLQARDASEDLARAQVLALAKAVAAAPGVAEAVASAAPSQVLQPMAERERHSTGADFVVVMSPGGVRYTHPNPELIGKPFGGHFEEAARGGEVVENYTGTLGPSTRAVVPVLREDEVVGLVAVGIRRSRVERDFSGRVPGILVSGVVAGSLAGLGTWLAARRVRRETRGLGTAELRRVHAHHDAVLRAVQEGLLILDAQGRIDVLNSAAAELLGISQDAVGTRIEEVGLAPSLESALLEGVREGKVHRDTQHASGGRILVLNTNRTVESAQAASSLVATFRDRTDLEELTDELSSARSLAEALHSQNHEARNKLHAVVTLIELGNPGGALEFATGELAASQRLTDDVTGAIREPAVAAMLVGKSAQAAERGIAFSLDPDAHLPVGVAAASDLITILGNLVDNAMDAVPSVDGEVVVDVGIVGEELVITVSDNGPGLAAPEARDAFVRGWTTKGGSAVGGRGLGLALVEQTAARLGGSVSVSEPPGATFLVRLPRERLSLDRDPRR